MFARWALILFFVSLFMGGVLVDNAPDGEYSPEHVTSSELQADMAPLAWTLIVPSAPSSLERHLEKIWARLQGQSLLSLITRELFVGAVFAVADLEPGGVRAVPPHLRYRQLLL